jgi:Na+/glutamate symporter
LAATSATIAGYCEAVIIARILSKLHKVQKTKNKNKGEQKQEKERTKKKKKRRIRLSGNMGILSTQLLV